MNVRRATLNFAGFIAEPRARHFPRAIPVTLRRRRPQCEMSDIWT